MKPVDIEELERLMAEATPGEWTFQPCPKGWPRGYWCIVGETGWVIGNPQSNEPASTVNECDGEFIAALQRSAPALLAELRALRSENAKLLAVRDAAAKYANLCNPRPSDAMAELEKALAQCPGETP